MVGEEVGDGTGVEVARAPVGAWFIGTGVGVGVGLL